MRISPVILVYYSFSIVDISDDEGADQLLYIIAELVFGVFFCMCTVFCSGCWILGSGSHVEDQNSVTLARLGWCSWFTNLALGVTAIIIPTILLTDYPHLLSSAGTSLNIMTAAGVAVIVSGLYMMLWNCCLNPTAMHTHRVEQEANSRTGQAAELEMEGQWEYFKEGSLTL